jgi:hypothetical protein
MPGPDVLDQDLPDWQIIGVRCGTVEFPALWQNWDLSSGRGVRRGYQFLDLEHSKPIEPGELPTEWIRRGIVIADVEVDPSLPDLRRNDFLPGQALRVIRAPDTVEGRRPEFRLSSKDGKYPLGHISVESRGPEPRRGGSHAVVMTESGDHVDGPRFGVSVLLSPGLISMQVADDEALRRLGAPWPGPTLTPVAVIHSARVRNREVAWGVWQGTATTLEGLYRRDTPFSLPTSLEVDAYRNPPLVDYQLAKNPQYGWDRQWPECTELGTWADWVRQRIWEHPGGTGVWTETAPGSTIEALFARECPAELQGPLFQNQGYDRR